MLFTNKRCSSNSQLQRKLFARIQHSVPCSTACTARWATGSLCTQVLNFRFWTLHRNTCHCKKLNNNNMSKKTDYSNYYFLGYQHYFMYLQLFRKWIWRLVPKRCYVFPATVFIVCVAFLNLDLRYFIQDRVVTATDNLTNYLRWLVSILPFEIE